MYAREPTRQPFSLSPVRRADPHDAVRRAAGWNSKVVPALAWRRGSSRRKEIRRAGGDFVLGVFRWVRVGVFKMFDAPRYGPARERVAKLQPGAPGTAASNPRSVDVCRWSDRADS